MNAITPHEPLISLHVSPDDLGECHAWRIGKMFFRTFMTGCVALACSIAPAFAQIAPPRGDVISSWLAMVGRIQDEQPHWMTPLVTVTPRLEQEFRFDVYSETLNNHAHLENYGAGKGVEFIPSEQMQVFIGVPPYDVRTSNAGKTLAEGWADWPVLLLKYRIISANEEQGNYIATGFFQLSAPTGNSAFTNHFYILQPTIAFGKGWGDFDLQVTISEQFAVRGVSTNEKNFGNPVLVNGTAQFHLFDVLWPELEVNATWWPGGTKEGKIQSFITPGVIFGRFQIHDRVRLIMGAGYQIAISPISPAYRSNLVVTARTTF
jgi:hypothetical protein